MVLHKALSKPLIGLYAAAFLYFLAYGVSLVSMIGIINMIITGDVSTSNAAAHTQPSCYISRQ
jgi:hypothetical protein